MKEKILLIAGCSHAAGSEIDGSEDSEYNRHHCFGSQLAARLGYKPINISIVGNSNSGIARSVLKWFETTYNPKKMTVMVLVAWTDGTRMEIPVEVDKSLPEPNHANWVDVTAPKFYRLTFGYEGDKNVPGQVEQTKRIHQFVSENEKFAEIISLNYALQLQYFFNSKKVDYLMCNSMPIYYKHTNHLGYYLSLIDQTKYYGVYNSEQAFYIKYKNEGYTNPKAKYWHHDEIPHTLYTEELYNFIQENK